MSIEVDFCGRAAALYAVERWHYSRTLPTPPLFRLGVWEDERFVGAVLFSRGNTQQLGTPYGLRRTEVCELSRVALDDHETPTTQILAEALRVLKETNPGLRLVVSFADPNVGHLGTVYQAGGWIYGGRSSPDYKVVDRAGREWHSRQVSPSGWKVQLRRTPEGSSATGRSSRPAPREVPLPHAPRSSDASTAPVLCATVSTRSRCRERHVRPPAGRGGCDSRRPLEKGSSIQIAPLTVLERP